MAPVVAVEDSRRTLINLMSDDLAIVRDVLGEDLSPESIERAMRSPASVIRPLVRAWYSAAVHKDKFPPRKPGELSLFMPESIWRPDTRGSDVAKAFDGGLAALLYVHRVVINSPLLMLSSAAMRGKPIEWCEDLLLTSLHTLHSLKHLIDSGVVVIIASDGNYYDPHVREAIIERVGQHQFDDLGYMALRTIELSLSSGCAVDLFAKSDEEYSQLKSVFRDDASKLVADRTDSRYLSAFVDELVPDVGNLDLDEVLRIRQDDSFEAWRVDLRRALRRMITVKSVEELSSDSLQEVQETMHECAARIDKVTETHRSMRELRRHAASFVVGGVGALVMAPIVGGDAAAGEVAMLAGAMGVGALAAGVGAASRVGRTSQSALDYHYAFVGKCASGVSN